MNSPADLARALFRKATDDCYVAQRLAQDADAPGWILGFHAQQAVEKALEAVLSFHLVEFPRTHNLSMLLELVRRANLPVPIDGDDLVRLIPFGVMARYEDALSGDEIAVDRGWAVAVAARTVEWAKQIVDADKNTAEAGK